ncbi:MAG: hypothetical protein NTW86_14685 [Candidatus Sumerlaeota bacterium]|nr:hypothetical protein [Candidatus Sumerlaeota bacterium]
MRSFVLLLLVTAVVGAISIRLVPFAYDDAYLHFRIAENFAELGKPYFNPEERVMATSSLLWTCVLALLYLTRIPLIYIVALLNTGATVVGSLLWSRLLSRVVQKKFSLSTLWIFRLVYIGILLPSSAGLMETPLAMALLGGCCLLLTQGRSLGSFLLALSIFTRPELIVFVPVLAAMQYVTHSGRILRHVICFVAPAVAFSLLSLFFFSTLQPQTMVAKQVIYTLPREQVFHDVLYSLIPAPEYPILGMPVASRLQHAVFPLLSWAWMPGICFLLGFACCGVPWKSLSRSPRQRWILCMGLAALTIAFSYVMKHVHLHQWYVPLFSIPTVFFYFGTSQSSRAARVATLALAVLPISTVVGYTLGASGCYRVMPGAASRARVQRYIEVGSLLHDLFPGARLMTSEIGGLGYGFKGEILDAVGLVTPGALKYHPITGSDSGIGGIPLQFVEDENPEVIVSYPVFLSEVVGSPVMDSYCRISIPAFSARWRRCIGEQGFWGGDSLYIYVRKDIADVEKLLALSRGFEEPFGPVPDGARDECR